MTTPVPTPSAFTIPHTHPALPGHFPGRPVVPGVVVLAQVLAAVERQLGLSQLSKLPQVKFLQPLLPGERAELQLEHSAPTVRFRVLRDGVLLASGQLEFAP